MSVVIEIGYERDEELLEVSSRLEDLPLKTSKVYQNGSMFKRVYLKGEVLKPTGKAAKTGQKRDNR